MATEEEKKHLVDLGLTAKPLLPNENLKLQANITLGDFVFNTIDEFGVTWVITDIGGWWNPPAAEVPDIPRGYGDGSYDVQGRYAARTLQIEGSFLVSAPSQVEAARDRLAAAVNLVYKGAWLKTGNDPIRASWVRLSGETAFETINSRGRTNFSFTLVAPDPVKYSWNDENPDGWDIVEIPVKNIPAGYVGSNVVNNIGNYSVPCYLEITGGFSSPGSIYNRTNDQLLLLTQSLKGLSGRSVVNKQASFDVATLKDVATLTTTAAHDFSVGNSVYVSGIGEPFDGDQIITSVPTDTTFTFDIELASITEVSNKSLTSGVARLEVTTAHGLSVGQKVTVSGVDSVFDGEYTVTSVPTPETITYARTRIPPSTVTSKILTSNIATLTTSGEHQFIVGEQVTVSGVDVNYNGTFTITDIPDTTSFSYASTRTNARTVTDKAMADDVVTLTTNAAHGFVVNEGVNVSSVDISLNGGYTITEVTSNTFKYKRPRGTVKSVSVKALSGNVATITTSSAHGFALGEKVRIVGVDSTFDGTYTITSLPSNTTFTYAKSASDLVPTIVSNATVHSMSRVIKSRQLVGGTVTINTTNAHGAIIGEQITISGLGSPFDGTYVVATIPTANSLTYTKSSANVAQADAPASSYIDLSGTITAQTLSTTGLATVAGSLPYSSATGSASVSADIPSTRAAGNLIKKNDIPFTPGLSGATAVVDADILEIDTKNREVAFNGELEGARGKVDVLADFITLDPGLNTIEFHDVGDPESNAVLRVYYRSGWLG